MTHAETIIWDFMNVPIAGIKEPDFLHSQRCAIIHVKRLIQDKAVTIYQLESNLMDVPHSKDERAFAKQEIKNIRQEIRELNRLKKQIKITKYRKLKDTEPFSVNTSYEL